MRESLFTFYKTGPNLNAHLCFTISPLFKKFSEVIFLQVIILILKPALNSGLKHFFQKCELIFKDGLKNSTISRL